MFTYIFYIGGMALVGLVTCSILAMGYRNGPNWIRGRAGLSILTIICVATMLGLPYAGFSHASRSKDITKRNNAFAALEAEIFKMDFDRQCTFNGYEASPRTPASDSFPCIQRGNIRIAINPFRTGLTYYIVDRTGTPERWRGMVDYPIPFSFPQERKLLDPDWVKATFMMSGSDANNAPVTAAE